MLPSVGRAGTTGGGGKKSAVAEEPDSKRRRLLEAGGPVEDDEVARRKMREAKVYKLGVDGTLLEYDGFDPDNVADVKSLIPYDVHQTKDTCIKPMAYFADEGDLPMMRWLYVNGADTRNEDASYWFPMYQAARHGHLDVCKWLYEHGAAGDVKRRTHTGFTPLSTLFDESDKRDVCRWLILRGALCKDGVTGDLDVDLMRQSLNRFDESAEERPELLKWAREHHQFRSSFGVFLMGTLSSPTYSVTKLRNELLARNRSEKVVDRLLECVSPDECRLLWDDLFPRRVCPLAVFAGKSGILELIGDYIAIVRGQEARIIRQLTELLPDVIAELDRETDSDESSDDGDYY